MTRKEAKKEFWKQNGIFERGLATSYEKVIKSYFIGSEFDRFIDKIYNDFESRLCKNCIFFDKEKNECINEDNIQIVNCYTEGRVYINMEVNESFGCNKFKGKNNENKTES